MKSKKLAVISVLFCVTELPESEETLNTELKKFTDTLNNKIPVVVKHRFAQSSPKTHPHSKQKLE